MSAPLTSEKSRSKRCKACSDVEGTVKIDVLIFSQQTETPRNGPSGPRRKCGVQAFLLKAKILAQGQFICPEHVKSKGEGRLRRQKPKKEGHP